MDPAVALDPLSHTYIYIDYLYPKTLSQTGAIELEREWHFGHSMTLPSSAVYEGLLTIRYSNMACWKIIRSVLFPARNLHLVLAFPSHVPLVW